MPLDLIGEKREQHETRNIASAAMSVSGREKRTLGCLRGSAISVRRARIRCIRAGGQERPAQRGGSGGHRRSRVRGRGGRSGYVASVKGATAADAGLFYLDDTTHRILSAKPEQRTRNGKTRLRTGVYTSAVLAIVDEQAREARACERRVVLFQTDIGHAGEWMDEILARRAEGLPAPIAMSDAASANTIGAITVKQARCNSHGRRGFVDVAASYPDEALYALETYAPIWQNERHCREAGLDPGARLAYHREHSAAPMDEIRRWCEDRLGSGAVEENGTLGGAMRYFLNHFDGLTLFLTEPRAPIDNNEIERLIKLVVRGRKNSGYFKSEVGAGVADVIGSVLATCHENAVNGFEYLVAVQRNRAAVRAAPERWLPWNYPREGTTVGEASTAAA